MKDYVQRKNWYTIFCDDNLKNVHLLIRNEVEVYAGRKATTFAATHHAESVTLKLMKPKSTPPLLNGDNIA